MLEGLPLESFLMWTFVSLAPFFYHIFCIDVLYIDVLMDIPPKISAIIILMGPSDQVFFRIECKLEFVLPYITPTD